MEFCRPPIKRSHGIQSRHADTSFHRRLKRRFSFESCEPRQMLTADPLFVGAVYTEDDSGNDVNGDIFELTFLGGASGSELTYIKIDMDHNGVPGVQDGDLFFDSVRDSDSLGRGNAVPYRVEDVVQSGDYEILQTMVDDGSTFIEFWFSGFTADDKLAFVIDVDEANDLGFDPNNVNLGVDRIASGNEFQASTLEAIFTAPRFHNVSTSATTAPHFVDDYTLPGVGLNLTDDGESDRTAGIHDTLIQVPLPISISGIVFHDLRITGS